VKRIAYCVLRILFLYAIRNIAKHPFGTEYAIRLMTPQLRRLALAFAAAFALVALTTGYWAFVAQDSLTARLDNPRRVLAERRVKRGTIYDRNGAPLAYSVGEPGEFTRYYPYPDLAPVLGYISAFYGSAGVEAAADAVLHGDAGRDELSLWWGDLLGAPPPGRDMRLSIDLRLQMAADEALGDHTGAVALVDPATGEILALASHPTYDPNHLEAEWEALVSDPRAPLLNRATFALYQPGGALQPIILAAALQAGLTQLDAPYPSAAVPIIVGDLRLGCLAAPGSRALTLAEAFQHGCPRPFADLGQRLGARALDQLFKDFRFYEAPAIVIPTTAAPHLETTSQVPLAAVGQGALNLTPLHLALAAAAIARGGELPAPRLVIAEQQPDGDWQPFASLSHPIAALAPEYADQVKALIAEGHQALALTGQEGQSLAWYSGFAPLDEARYAIAVLLEDGSPQEAAKIGREVLTSGGER